MKRRRWSGSGTLGVHSHGSHRIFEVPTVSADLATIVTDFAHGIEAADSLSPVAVNQRTGEAFRPGIGPHPEADAVSLVMKALSRLYPERYRDYSLAVRYPGTGRRKCDLCLGTSPNWEWAIEVKSVRFLGDNAKPNDSILMHVLSPYPSHRSALTDCEKLRESGLPGRKAILVYGFEDPTWPLEPVIAAFECLARARGFLGVRHSTSFTGLIHPVHSRGVVLGWDLHLRPSESH